MNGLLSKFMEIQHFLNTVKFDVFEVTETHLKENNNDEFIRIEGYSIARNDRVNKVGGCVLIYYREDLDIHQDLFASTGSIEEVWLTVKMRSQSIMIGCLY